MKIALVSDVHLEFGPLVLENEQAADVLILSGDICVSHDLRTAFTPSVGRENDRSDRFHTFFEDCCNKFANVIYVMGNHEHYHGDFALSYTNLCDKLSYLKNLHILEKQLVKIDDVTFIGGTLWTDMNKEDDLTLYHMRSMMNDFRIVMNSNREVRFKDDRGVPHVRVPTFCAEDSVEDHKAMMQFIRHSIEGKFDEKFVVVGHHAPSKLSTKPRYANEKLMNGAYSSDLSEFILDHPQIKLWTHGHTHDKFDYTIGSTRIVCNPRGYIGYESCAHSFKLEYIEL
jgi:Icc-related predicted phosphoesterase